MMMTIKAYSTVLGAWSEPVFALLVLFFAFATVICWAHYGRSALAYLTEKTVFHHLYLIALAVSVFFGTNAAPASVWTVSDFALGIMTLINIAVLLLMRREVKAETVRFLSEAKGRSGKRKNKNGTP